LIPGSGFHPADFELQRSRCLYPFTWDTRGILLAGVALAAAPLVFSLGDFLRGHYQLGLNSRSLQTLTFFTSQAGVYLLCERGIFGYRRPAVC
jgi:hypothetical protein